jgi:SAM-dependent methyltransferase
MPEGSGPGDAWSRYLSEYHDANPGITEAVLADAHDPSGRTPYDWLVEAVPAGPSTVVDLACGSGPVARLLAVTDPTGHRVVGVDRSAGELAQARVTAPGQLLVRARVTAVPLADGIAGAVVASMALMLAPLEAVLGEAARLLRPGGTFAATVPNRSTAVPPGMSAFHEILDALGQSGTDYPEPLAAGLLSDRFSASGLTLDQDDSGVFTRIIEEPDDARRVVHSFYAPGADAARVADAVSRFQERVRSAPVRIGYRIRRLVAVRCPA